MQEGQARAVRTQGRMVVDGNACRLVLHLPGVPQVAQPVAALAAGSADVLGFSFAKGSGGNPAEGLGSKQGRPRCARLSRSSSRGCGECCTQQVAGCGAAACQGSQGCKGKRSRAGTADSICRHHAEPPLRTMREPILTWRLLRIIRPRSQTRLATATGTPTQASSSTALSGTPITSGTRSPRAPPSRCTR